MSLWVAALWGLAGGMSVEGLELYARIHRTRGWSWRKPIPQGLAPYLLSIVIRGGFSVGVATAAAASQQVVGAFAIFGIGVAAPLVIEKLAQSIPLTADLSTLDLSPPSTETQSKEISSKSTGVSDAR